ALSVGDAVFANRCIRKFEELREKKTTILFVSHDLGLVKQLSNRVIFLLNGQSQAEGEPKHVINQYIGVVLERQKAYEKKDERPGLTASFRHGDGSSEVVEALLVDRSGQSCAVVESGETVTVRIRAVFRERRAQPMVGILIRNRIGIDVYGTNTRIEQVESGIFEAGEE